jgi:hypothetical protein
MLLLNLNLAPFSSFFFLLPGSIILAGYDFVL